MIFFTRKLIVIIWFSVFKLKTILLKFEYRSAIIVAQAITFYGCVNKILIMFLNDLITLFTQFVFCAFRGFLN